jgi:branched-chain amino acid transport system ATP-binding protein
MLLEIQDLIVDYGKARALDSVSLNIAEGEIVALIGPNGAGKTTLLRTISGLVSSVSGMIFFKTFEISGLAPAEIVQQGIAHCPEGGKVFAGMTVLENLKIGAYVRKDDITHDLDYVFSLFRVLKNRQSQIAGSLSGGEQIMLSIGRALMLKPSLLLVDEPTLGLAPMVCMELGNKLREISEQKTSILLVEQNAQLAFSISDRCYVIENGRVVIQGRTKAIEENSHVKEVYLGL